MVEENYLYSLRQKCSPNNLVFSDMAIFAECIRATDQSFYSQFQAMSSPTYCSPALNHCCTKNVAHSNLVLPRTDPHWTQYLHFACCQRSTGSFRSLCMQPIDLKAAFDSVDRSALWKARRGAGTKHSSRPARGTPRWNNMTGSPRMQAVKPIYHDVRL